MNQVLNPLAWIFNSERYKRSILPPEIYDAHFVSKAVSSIQERWVNTGNTPKDESSPIFILAAGWGSGSTLVQRIVMSSQEVLVWGEPYDRAAPVHRISSTISPIEGDWPPESHYGSVESLDNLSKSWVANLAPPIESLRTAHLAFFNSWLGLNKEQNEATRWGLKEVRLTIDHARYLKWLYPNARFLFVYRDLLPGYLGCRRR
ncbi:MAG: sulfotransferase, partial [Acidiferrobacterales bacterium]|nr:sulfotransferase [Acidiferrobacterales bacterium]